METKVNANPTKEFFISMLTRDVDIKAAILELIDNSIDGAKRLRPNGDYSGLYIKIKYDKSSFSIVDNCGGISIKTATETAFRFGRSVQEKNEKDQQFTGVFGIGMKRSLFRLGKFFEVESRTEKEYFKLSVDVDEWVKDTSTDWSFSFSEVKNEMDNKVEETGTQITVTHLHDGISKQFESAYFFTALVTYIERFKTLAVENGLVIQVNGHPITFANEQLIESEIVTPYTCAAQVGPVKYSIIAGLAPKGHPEKAGWYIYCNGRLVVFADKTTLSGWGEDGIRHYHPSLAFFRGFVFFESTEPDHLPWNTAKTGIDTSSKYFIAAKVKMKEATEAIVRSCKHLCEEELSAEEEAKILSVQKLISLNTNSITRLALKNQLFELKVDEVKDIEPTTTINFKKPKRIVDIAKKQMEVSTNKEVGIIAFDYYFKRECDDDE